MGHPSKNMPVEQREKGFWPGGEKKVFWYVIFVNEHISSGSPISFIFLEIENTQK